MSVDFYRLTIRVYRQNSKGSSGGHATRVGQKQATGKR